MSGLSEMTLFGRERVDQLSVVKTVSGREMGRAAAIDIAAAMSDAVAARGQANLVLATGDSQLDFVAELIPRINWSAVNLFHQDEYVGISAEHPASFRCWMVEHVLAEVRPRSWNPLNGDAREGAEAETRRYAELLARMRPDVTVIGIGENGHIAFNDPPADIATREWTAIVELDDICRRQQVNEGHFATIHDVPSHAITLTVAGLFRSRRLAAVVPELRKALAVRCAVQAPISPLCPASLLRANERATLYLDELSSSLLDSNDPELPGFNEDLIE